MILDTLANSSQYLPLHPAFAAAFEWLEKADFAALEDGRYDILEDDLAFALVQSPDGRGRTAAKLEAHQKFIDIQVTISGDEEIGWQAISACQTATAPYDAEKDFILYEDASLAWVAVPAGNFAVFFPEDGHAPLAGTGPLRKVVVKVKVQAPK